MSYSIDYFAVLGRKDGKLQCGNVKSSWDESKQCHPSDVWNDAITDMVVVTESNRDDFDCTWTIVDQSLEGIEFADLDIRISLAFRRRRESKRLDHITQVRAQA